MPAHTMSFGPWVRHLRSRTPEFLWSIVPMVLHHFENLCLSLCVFEHL